jgi:hypothetical protein
MKLINFNDVDLFNCKFGKWNFDDENSLYVYVVKGFYAPKEVLDCVKPKLSYILDPWTEREYDSWELTDSGLRVHVAGDSKENFYVCYKKEHEINELLKYRYYGGLWLVFKGVVCSSRDVFEYTERSDRFTGKEWSEVDSLDFIGTGKEREFLLEGVFLDIPAWVNWNILAESVFLTNHYLNNK